MAFVKSNDYNELDASVINHGSAAGPSVQAALPPMAAGIVPSTSQAPLATAMLPGTATGSLGNTGVEYGIPHHGHPRRIVGLTHFVGDLVDGRCRLHLPLRVLNQQHRQEGDGAVPAVQIL